MQKTSIYRIVSFVALVLLISFVLIAYVRMLNIFDDTGLKGHNALFMAFVWVIILSAFVLFYINWQNILQLESLLARSVKTIEERVQEHQDTEDEEESFDAGSEAKALLSKFSLSGKLDADVRAFMELMARHFEVLTAIAFYSSDGKDYRPLTTFAWFSEEPPNAFAVGEGLAGQAAARGKDMLVNDLPAGYIRVVSATGSASASDLLINPPADGEEPRLLIEWAFFKPIDQQSQALIREALIRFRQMLNTKNSDDE